MSELIWKCFIYPYVDIVNLWSTYSCFEGKIFWELAESTMPLVLAKVHKSRPQNSQKASIIHLYKWQCIIKCFSLYTLLLLPNMLPVFMTKKFHHLMPNIFLLTVGEVRALYFARSFKKRLLLFLQEQLFVIKVDLTADFQTGQPKESLPLPSSSPRVRTAWSWIQFMINLPLFRKYLCYGPTYATVNKPYLPKLLYERENPWKNHQPPILMWMNENTQSQPGRGCGGVSVRSVFYETHWCKAYYLIEYCYGVNSVTSCQSVCTPPPPPHSCQA